MNQEIDRGDILYQSSLSSTPTVRKSTTSMIGPCHCAARGHHATHSTRNPAEPDQTAWRRGRTLFRYSSSVETYCDHTRKLKQHALFKSPNHWSKPTDPFRLDGTKRRIASTRTGPYFLRQSEGTNGTNTKPPQGPPFNGQTTSNTGILLTGGGDVSPYLSSQGEQAKGPSAPSDYLLEPRDKTECALIEASKYNEMPVLGICRGLQQINLFHGGSLTPVEEHVALEHELASCNDDGQYSFPKRVNSFHAWGIYDKDLGDGMVPLAMAGNTVEAARHQEFKHFGIMWHPERARGIRCCGYRTFQRFLRSDYMNYIILAAGQGSRIASSYGPQAKMPCRA